MTIECSQSVHSIVYIHAILTQKHGFLFHCVSQLPHDLVGIFHHAHVRFVCADLRLIFLAEQIFRNQLREPHVAVPCVGIAAAKPRIDFGNIIFSVNPENIHVDRTCQRKRGNRLFNHFKQRRILSLGLLFQLGMLVVLKYTPFFLSNYNALLQALHADPASTLYVGDSNVDVETAHNANLPCCGAVWGFRTREELNAAGAEYLAENSDELYDVIMK